jgi:hypothetical protein
MNRVIAGLMVLILSITAWGMYLSGLGLRLNTALFQRAGFVALTFLGSRLIARKGRRWQYHLMLIIFWMALSESLHFLPMYLAGRQEVSLSDDVLARWDKAIGIETPAVMASVRSHPALDEFLGHTYMSMITMANLAMILAALSGRMAAAMENILASLISVCISFPIFAVFQAWGPWRYYGYVPSIDQRGYEEQFLALKQHAFFYIDYAQSKGIICFPSYHTIFAVLAAITLSRIPFLWPLGTLWATLIVISTVTTGTHYLIDVLAGLLVAAASILIARYSTRAFRSRYSGMRAEQRAAATGKTAGVIRAVHTVEIGPDLSRGGAK